MAKLHFNPALLNSHDKALYDSMVEKRKKQGAPFGGPYAALMNHPKLCEKVEALGYYLKFQGHLPRDVYQFIVLCVSKETKASFEWNDHVHHALDAGVPQEVIDHIDSQGTSYENYPNPYQYAAQILSFTLKWKNIPEPVQAQAIKIYGMEGYIEVVVLSGFYQMFSAINQGFDIIPA